VSDDRNDDGSIARMCLDGSRSSSEVPAALFRPEAKDQHKTDNDRELERGESPGVAKMLAEKILHGKDRGRHQHAKLINEAGEKAAYRIRRQLVEMRRDYSKSSLHPGLHQAGSK